MSVDHRSAVKWIFMDVASAAPVNQTFFQEGKKESQLVQQYMCFSEYGYQKGMTRDKAGYSLGRKKNKKKKNWTTTVEENSVEPSVFRLYLVFWHKKYS